jgi:iron complex outermembrane receptor protein
MFALGLFGVAAGLASAPALAQSKPAAPPTSDTSLEEITVTARKVEENLMTVPVSVTALTSRDIEQSDMKDMQDISLTQPSFHFVNQVGGQSGIADRSSFLVTFRGLVEGPAGTATTGSGSVFIDGAPVVDAQIPTLDEIERVEVLKGPQSAYFGRSTFAGAINYITKDPSLTEFHGSATAEASSYNSSDGSLSLSIPVISDELGLRVNARHLVKGGEYTNAADTDQKFGTQTTDSFSSTLLFVPTDKLRVKGYLNWFTDNDGPPAEADIKDTDGIFNSTTGNGANYSGGYFKGPIPNVGQLPTSIISGNYAITPFLQAQDFGNAQGFPLTFAPDFLNHAGLRRDALVSDIKINWEFAPGYDLSSLTSYYWAKSEELIDLDFRYEENKPNPIYFPGSAALFGPYQLPYEAFNLVSERLAWDYSQEFRITSPRDDKLKWSAGASFLHTLEGFSLFGQWDLGVGDLGAIEPIETNTPAAFGSISYELIDKLTLTFEAREQWDELREQAISSGGLPVSMAAGQLLTADYRTFSPRLTLDYAYAPDSDAYVLFSRGFRPGGFNSYVLTAPAAALKVLQSLGANTNLSYAQERLDNYEAGLKSTFLDGKARTTIAVYYDKWTDGQIATVYNVKAGESSNQYSPINNSGLIDLYGFEFEGELKPVDKLLLHLTAAYNGTRVVSYSPCTDCLNFGGTGSVAGDHVPNVPQVTASFSAEYSDHLFQDYNYFGRAEYNFQGSQYLDYTNVAWTQPQKIVNLHLGIRNGSLTLDAFVRNLTNNSAPNSTTSQTDPVTFFEAFTTADVRYALPDKRTAGLRATYKF